jgi:hypothetical protein
MLFVRERVRCILACLLELRARQSLQRLLEPALPAAPKATIGALQTHF